MAGLGDYKMDIYNDQDESMRRILMKSVINHVYLSQWELAAASVKLVHHLKIDDDDVRNFLKQVINHPSNLRYGTVVLTFFQCSIISMILTVMMSVIESKFLLSSYSIFCHCFFL